MKSAVLLAAGEGTGTWPFSGARQKVTVPILNVPMVRRMAIDLIALGIDEIVTVIGHRGEAVRACLADLDAVRFVTQKALTGPVDAALSGLDTVTGEQVLVCCADIVTTRHTLDAFLRAFDDRKADAMVLTAPCPEDTPHWTTVEADPEGLLSGVRGHGEKDRPRFAGIAAAKTELLERYLLRNPGIMDKVGVGAMPPPEGDLAHSFGLMHDDGIEVHAFDAPDFVVDVDRPWHIVDANAQAARHAFATMEQSVIGEGASVDDGAHIASDAKLLLGPGAHIGKDVHIEGSLMLGANSRVTTGAILRGPAVIGANSRCEHYCNINAGAVIGSNCLVSHCAELSGILFDTVFLYHYCSITGLVGCNVDIGAATVCGTWRFDDGTKPHVVKGHKETPGSYGALTYIGDYCRTGVNVMFMPGVKIGSYSCVGPGAIVSEDLPERSLLLAKQEQVVKEWGPQKYGW
ncbi:MAG: NTP transferase domain-containing protein [bacterium]|nr:NTP transferase domain-containing protein [bacterium]